MPDRKRNTTEVITQHTNTDSRSVTNPWKANPRPKQAITIGRRKAISSNMFPAIGKEKMSGT